MTQKSNEVDMLIKKVIQKEIKSIPPPMPMNKAWEQIESRLNEQQPSYNRTPFYKNKLFYAVAIIFISLIIILSPQTSGAYSKLVEVFQNVQENVTQLFIKVEDGNSSGENPPFSDDMYLIEEPDMTLLELSIEEAQEETAFFIKQPKFVPEDYALKNVTVIKGVIEQSNEVFLNYEGRKGDFEINQKMLEESFSGGITIDNDDAEVDSLDIHGQSASLLKYHSGFLELIWVTESHYYAISGVLSQEEIIEIAKSL